MTPREEALQLIRLVRNNIVGDRDLVARLQAAQGEIAAGLQRAMQLEGADAAAIQERLQYHLDQIGEDLLSTRFRLREWGNLLLHYGRAISEACSADELLDALAVAADLRPEIQAEKGVPLLHAIFAYGGENSVAGQAEGWIDPDRQPMTWQFNLAMVDWMCRTDRGSEACNAAFEETFGFLPAGWKRKPSVLQKCGVSQ